MKKEIYYSSSIGTGIGHMKIMLLVPNGNLITIFCTNPIATNLEDSDALMELMVNGSRQSIAQLMRDLIH